MRRETRPRGFSRTRTLTPTVDRLEFRELLSTVPSAGLLSQAPAPVGPVLHPMFEVGRLVANASPPGGAYTPAQIQQAYGFGNVTFSGVKGDGTGQTIAIVDAYHDPNILADLNAFDTQFGLPAVTATTFTQFNQTGGTSYPSVDSTGGWEMEIALDVEWAHAVAPAAKIMLVEANSANDNDLLTAVNYASAHANVVSMSWGGGEFSGETSYDSYFSKAGVAFVASSGDSGAPISWPAASSNVLAVGGTALTLGSGNAYASESGWSGSGGGPSAYVAQPSYQAGVVTQKTSTQRANPDVAYDASPSTGFAVYDSYPNNGTTYGWLTVGGTSAGAPQWAALLAIADQGRAAAGLPALDSTNPQEVLSTLYKDAGTADFHDVTTGTSTGTTHYNAGAGYDYVTGLGSPAADLIIPSLVGTAPAPVSNDHLVISAATSETAGTAFTVTVTAQNKSNFTDGGYTGTVHFSSSDVQAGLPANYTFTTADAGSKTFSLTLKTAGSQSITATDSTTTATQSGITVSPAAATQFILTGLPSTATAGAPQTLTVTAKDTYGNVATGYTGTVHFTSTDQAATLPIDTAFSSSSKGVQSFNVTFQTAGTQKVTVKDTISASLTATTAGVSVAPNAPTALTASAGTNANTQINLSWTGPAGTSNAPVLIERSTTGGTWTQIASVTSGTTYSDSGLSPGTTYSYRVRVASNGVNSAYSNTSSLTTTGVSTATSLWSNSFTPTQDKYASGSYEVGMKFQSSVSGTVTGARFYKQTWMDGYTHIGHLWSSTGALLATAKFTNETYYGWEQVSFSSPVAISANTQYIISFSTGGGYFGITSTTFASAGFSNGSLQAPVNAGVYHSGNSTFPNVNGGGMNFWADVVFSPSVSSSVVTASPKAVAGYVAPVATTAAAKSSVSQAVPFHAQKDAVAYSVSWPNRRTVTQALSLASGHHHRGFFAS